MLNCRANITVTRLDCWVALPTVIPPDIRVDVIWYWRSLHEAERGSNVAFEVTNSPPFHYIRTLCNRQPVCPTNTDNLTVDISQLEISRFGVSLQGDYACRVVLINQTTDTVEQVMQPSACARLKLEPDQMQNCEIYGQRTMWNCADTAQQLTECPQELQTHPTPTSTSATHISLLHVSQSYVLKSSLHSLTSTTAPVTLETSSHLSRSTSFSTTHASPTPPGAPAPTDDITNTSSYIYILLTIVSLLLLGGIGTAASVILGIRRLRRKRSTNFKEGRP